LISTMTVKPVGTARIEAKPIAAVHVQRLRLRLPL
jgi:hypothetical protein